LGSGCVSGVDYQRNPSIHEASRRVFGFLARRLSYAEDSGRTEGSRLLGNAPHCTSLFPGG